MVNFYAHNFEEVEGHTSLGLSLHTVKNRNRTLTFNIWNKHEK